MSTPIRYIAEADGGSRGNPGPAGYGAVVRDAADDLVLAERADGIGHGTNNVAEYRGLIAALEAALELGITELDMRMDSKLVVEQVSGRWKVKHANLQPLATRARALADKFDQITFTWIPRAQNSHADRLANEAMDAAAKGKSWSEAESMGGVDRPAAGAQPEAPVGDALPRESLVTGHPTTEPTTTLILLRHGETEQSLERRFSGRSDLPLTDKGKAQAQAAGARIAAAGDIAVVVSSPLLRTKQTAHAVAKQLGLDVHVDKDLREIDFGDWEGMTFGEAKRAGGTAFGEWAGSDDIAPPGGESMAQCRERVERARRRLTDKYAGQRVLVVTHMTPIKALLGDALDSAAAVRRINLDLCSLSRVDYIAGERPRSVVKLVNEISYLGSL
ncbi:putative phosphoglycerate mutase [Antricoccus suffuscus]|uniref:Putative phosphoglycerate mutase n=1 Tax=Antricoccus suffuscus TaxID=1629062 RepID=A0A2T0ZY90_9ACTN|nr:bifunctional RNase H/acid phosphatase [Antricoccus suffuscus]PRZ41310.1 putative phosphoglycerate mutase [Antricoccus suffuscus]